MKNKRKTRHSPQRLSNEKNHGINTVTDITGIKPNNPGINSDSKSQSEYEFRYRQKYNSDNRNEHYPGYCQYDNKIENRSNSPNLLFNTIDSTSYNEDLRKRREWDYDNGLLDVEYDRDKNRG